MPFETPYKETYTPGELVYGLGKPRGSLMSEKFGLTGPNIRTVDLSTIDDYATTGDEKASHRRKKRAPRSGSSTARRRATGNTALRLGGNQGN